MTLRQAPNISDMTPNTQSQRVQWFREIADLAKRRARVQIWGMIYFTSEQVYQLSESGFEHIWSEVLTRILWVKNREGFFQKLHAEWKSIPLVIAWLRWALMEIITWNISHPLSINIFVGDFMSRGFWRTIMQILNEYRASDTEKIEFELLEYWDPEKVDTFMVAERYRQLKDRGLSSVIDDFDLLWNDRDNISRILLEILYPLWCRKIKLDWKATQWLLTWDQELVRALEILQRNYPGLIIQAEWIRIEHDTHPLGTRWISLFQWSSFWEL